jgi:hypothetical protein
MWAGLALPVCLIKNSKGAWGCRGQYTLTPIALSTLLLASAVWGVGLRW